MDEIDLLEEELRKQLLDLYRKAIGDIRRRLAALIAALQAMDDAPDNAAEKQSDERLEQRFRQELRVHKAEKIAGEELGLAGTAAATLMLAFVTKMFGAARRQAVTRITLEAAPLPTRPAFKTLTERQLENILRESQGYFSKVAYRKLGSSSLARRRFRQALAASTRKGETQAKLVDRLVEAIGDASDKAYIHAALMAQTERTRAQSQAQDQVADEAVTQGLRLYDEWSCAMIPPHRTGSGWSSGSRESHKELNGKRVMHGERFLTIWGNWLRYPGDPEAPAREVCNCHCRKTSHVLLQNEQLIDGEVVKRGAD